MEGQNTRFISVKLVLKYLEDKRKIIIIGNNMNLDTQQQSAVETESKKWHLLKQYIEGTFTNGKNFSVEITPEFVNAVVIQAAQNYLGKKVKDAHIVFK